MMFVPIPGLFVVKEAIPELFISTEPRDVAPSLNVIVPVGVMLPVFCTLTWAVNVTL